MKPTRFMRIPFFVQGYPVTEDNMELIAKWCEGHVISSGDKPFVRVPVNRATNQKQTQAFVGTWVIVSVQRGERSFKVYTEEWLRKQFFELPEEALDQGISIEDLGETNNLHIETPNNVHAIPRFRTNGAPHAATT